MVLLRKRGKGERESKQRLTRRGRKGKRACLSYFVPYSPFSDGNTFPKNEREKVLRRKKGHRERRRARESKVVGSLCLCLKTTSEKERRNGEEEASAASVSRSACSLSSLSAGLCCTLNGGLFDRLLRLLGKHCVGRERSLFPLRRAVKSGETNEICLKAGLTRVPQFHVGPKAVRETKVPLRRALLYRRE